MVALESTGRAHAPPLSHVQSPQALEASNAREEANRLYKEVAENNFNNVDFALLRAQAKKKAG